MFNIPTPHFDSSTLDCRTDTISLEENDKICQIPEELEVKVVVFSLNATSAAGPGGFNGTFFQCCWDIIKEDVKAYVQEFFKGKKLTRYFSHTCLALIPKTKNPCSFGEFRPISLSNFTIKIVSKIISLRLNPLF